MYIDSSDVCQEALKMFNLENFFIIKIEKIISKKKKDWLFNIIPLGTWQKFTGGSK